MSHSRALWLLPVIVLAILCGCSKSKPSKYGVAVIDLDAVANRLGRDVRMNESLEQAAGAINQQFSTIQASYQTQFAETKNGLGAQPTEEQSQQLLALGQQINLKLDQTRQVASSKLGEHRLQLINRFREEVKPVARAVAAERGLEVVVSKNDSVIFTYTPSADITDEVVQRMIAIEPVHPRATGPSPSSSREAAHQSETHSAHRDHADQTLQR